MNRVRRAREVARALNVHTAKALEVHRFNDIRRVNVLPHIVRRVVCLLKGARGLIIENRVHQLTRGKASRQVVVGVRCRRGLPTFHRAVLHADRHAQILRIVKNRRKDLLELLEVLLKATICAPEDMIITDESSTHHIILIAAEKCRDTDELKDMILVINLLGRVATNQVIVGAHADAQPKFVALGNDFLCRVEVEGLIIEMGRRVVRAVRIAAEYAKLKSLRPHALRTRHNIVK